MKRISAKRILTHVSTRGVKMVNVSGKKSTRRVAVASAEVNVGRDLIQLLRGPGLPKGDVFTTAKLAGVLAAKRTCDLIPLCHGLSPDFVDVQIDVRPPDRLHIEAEAQIDAKTGVEMEAMVAAAVAALTVYDMCKSANKAIVIGPLRLEMKSGGKSGDFRRKSANRSPAHAG